MKLSKSLLMAALAATAFASPGKAEVLNFDGYCIMGSFQVCASVRLSSVNNTLVMQVWNLEGTLGTAHTMTAIGLYHTGTPWTGNVSSYTVAYGALDITDKWSAQGAGDIQNFGGISLEVMSGTAGNAGIIGCTNPGGSPDKWMTCNTFPGPAYVQFTFNLDSHFALGTDTELRWHSQQIGPNSISLKCDTGGLAENPCEPPTTTVTPEPVTMLLLGSGLAGVGAAARRRRKSGAEKIA